MPKNSHAATDPIAPSGPVDEQRRSGPTDEQRRTDPQPPQPRRKPELTKVSANFVPRAIAALDVASEITGDNQTDVLNRSVQVYAYISKMIDEGKLVFIEDPKTGAKERLVLL